MTPNAPASVSVVSFDLDANELVLGRFIDTTETLAQLVREVTASVVPGGGVRWIVDEVSMASPLHLAVRPVADTSAVTSVGLDQLTNAIVQGLATVERAAERPAYFTDRALEIARRLGTDAATPGTRLRFHDARARSFTVTSQLVANVDSILGQTITAIGTIEGRLEAFNVHGNSRYFNVYDDLTGERVRCDFAHRIDVREIGSAVERRVAVHGQIEYRSSGEIVRLIASSLDLFPEEDDLPSSESVRGILEG